MSTALPITINADSQLIEHFQLSKQALEKLEAWANFATLKANWYSDENKEVSLVVTLLADDVFDQLVQNADVDIWQPTSLGLLQTKGYTFKIISPFSMQETATEAAFITQAQSHLLAVFNQVADRASLDKVSD